LHGESMNPKAAFGKSRVRKVAQTLEPEP
jgi:hypothetical protein